MADTDDEGAESAESEESADECVIVGEKKPSRHFPLPWRNALTGSPPPPFRPLPMDNEQTSAVAQLPDYDHVFGSCSCGETCRPQSCGCCARGTGGYDGHGRLQRQADHGICQLTHGYGTWVAK